MKFFNYLLAILFCLPLSVSAEMMQCTAKKNHRIMPHFFDSSDKKSRKACTDKPVPYRTSTGKMISSHYKKPTKSKPIELNNLMAEQVASTPKCGGSGGTIKANGKIFHLDPVALCKKYGVKNKGRIAHGKARHVKLSRVAANFRRKIAPFVN